FMFVCYRHRQKIISQPLALNTVGKGFGGLFYSDADHRFYATDGDMVQLTPMQHHLMEMFFQSPSHSLTKTEICDALWPKKPDANDTLYTLIRRLKPVIEQHSELKIESDRSKAYRLVIK
ncbi:MAG: helix-turn-helix domain-containing protein, partial [Prevotella sp.]|nr:helix-turn-helix domain-containing protein [Prevotella sp.]